MTKLITFLSIILLLSGREQQRIIASYSAIACPCAQWKVDGEKETIFLERENEQLPDVNELWNGETLPFKVSVMGKFKKGKGVPKDYPTKGGNVEAAKIFVYSQMEIIEE